MILTETHPPETELSPSGLLDLQADYQEKRLTGLIRVILEKRGLLYLFYNQGQMAFAFLVHPEGQGEAIAAEKVEEVIGQTVGGSTHNIILSLPALRICKLAIIHTVAGATLNTNTNQLAELLNGWEKQKDPCFIRVRWKNAEGLTFYSGEGWSNALLFTWNEIREDGPAALFPSWTETSCKVTRFPVTNNSEAWQEFHLQRAFDSICTFMFKRYEEFTGSGLVQSVIWMMSEAAAAEHINVKVRQLQLEDQNLFPGPERAAQAYRLLIGKLTGRIRSLLGPALLNSITADAAFELSPAQRTVARMHRLLELGITVPILREKGGIS